VKIGLVLDDTLDKPDGVQQYVLLLGAWLTSQGHDVHYLVGHTTRTDVPNIHSLSRNVKVSFNQNKLSIPLPASRRRIKALLNELNLDVLHVQMPYSPFMAGRVISAAKPRTAIIGTFHILPFSRFEARATKLLGAILRPTLKRFSSVIAVSSAAASFAHSSFGVTPDVIPNMVDVEGFRRATSSIQKDTGHCTIVFLGRLVPRKGALELLHAVRALPAEVRQKLTVKIGGKGELLPVLEAYVRDNELSDTVQFDGFIEEAAKPAYLAQADIAVFPSLGGESFGIVLVEAMAAGAGVTMGGDNPGYRSVLGHWPEAICNPRDAGAFSDQLEQLITQPELCASIHIEQVAAVQAYDMSVVGTQILDIYKRHIA
jgi:phosphatidylinositol alpha-mannosyltransferase